MAILPVSVLQKLFSSARSDVLQAISDEADEVLSDYEVANSRTRLAYFLAQLGHESGGFRIFEENLNYSAKRLTQVWPKRFPSLAAAKPYANNPKALGNKTYANRIGNGNEASGDGFRFRGRGLIQITGRANYEAIGKITGLDLVGDPDSAADPDNLLLVACGYWRYRDLNRYADTNDFTGLTRAINGGTVGLADRRDWLKRVMQKLNAAGVGPEDVEINRSPGTRQPDSVNDEPAVVPEVVLKMGSRGEHVRALQSALKNIGYQPGAIDGVFGALTAREVLAFQLNNGLETTGVVDGVFWTALENPAPPALSNERQSATAEDLKELGSQTVLDGDRTKKLGWLAAVLGALGIGNSAVVQMSSTATVPAAATQAASPDTIAMVKEIAGLIPPDVLASNDALRKIVESVQALQAGGSTSGTGMQTIFDLLPGFFTSGVLNTGAGGLAQIMASILPGFGGSALVGIAGLVLSRLGGRIVNARVKNHNDGANTGR